MKGFLIFAIVVVILFSCDQPTSLSNNNPTQLTSSALIETKENQPQNTIPPDNLFTLTDAEKILGEPAHLADSSSTIKEDASRYSCAFFANIKDSKSGKTGCIYFLFEKYNRISSAKDKYSFIYEANKNHGTKELHDVGDEAYFHTDRENFYFIMVRKGASVFNMKVNKITSKTSLDEFNMIAKKITDSL